MYKQNVEEVPKLRKAYLKMTRTEGNDFSVKRTDTKESWQWFSETIIIKFTSHRMDTPVLRGKELLIVSQQSVMLVYGYNTRK